MFTNQDVYGLGELRDAGNENLALSMRPCWWEKPSGHIGILQTVRPFAGPGRQGGGFSAIDIACTILSARSTACPSGGCSAIRNATACACIATPPNLRPQEVRGPNGGAHEERVHLLQDGCHYNFVGIKPGYLDTEGVPTDKGLEYGAELITAVRDASAG